MTKMEKYIRYALVLSLTLLWSVNAYSQDITTGLIAHYPFDGNANDVSGNNLNGVENGSITYEADRFDEAGGAIWFSNFNTSAATRADLVTVTHDDILNTPSFTISFWYKQNASGNVGSGVILRKGFNFNHYEAIYGNSTTGDTHEVAINSNTGSVVTAQGEFKTSAGWLVNDNIARTYDANAWFLATFTYDNLLLKAYIDGELVGEQTLTSAPVFNSDNLFIGLGLNIFLDDLKIYNRALSQVDIDELFKDELNPLFTMDTQNGPAGTAINFTDQSTANGTIISREWFFDADLISDATSVNPSFTFNTPGVYSASLKVTDNSGRTRTIVKPFSIGITETPFEAPDLSDAEYFFDTDPGIGNGISITLNSSGLTDIVESLDINATGLSAGFHTLYIRSQNDEGKWSIAEGRTFYIQAPFTPAVLASMISKAEFFFDTDPGVGSGNAVSLGTGSDRIEESINAVATSLPTGFHTLYLRVADDLNKWGIAEGRTFYIHPGASSSTPATVVTSAEYFFDTDPGIGSGTSIDISSPSANVEEALNVSVNTLATGFHTLFMRVKDDKNSWSLHQNSTFYIQPGSTEPDKATAIVAAEFFFDADPGTGEATTINLNTTAAEIEEQISIASSGLAVGIHQLFIRVKDDNGIYSIASQKEIAITNGPLSNDNVLSLKEDAELTLKISDFNYNSASGTALTRIRIDRAPASGEILLNGSGIGAGRELLISDIEMQEFLFRPVNSFNGETSFEFTVGDAESYSIASSTIVITVESVNDAPGFTLSETAIIRDRDFTDEVVINVIKGFIPTDEIEQEITYSLTPETVDFASVSIEETTGMVSINSIPDKAGSREFTITADDGQAEDNLATQTFTLTVNTSGPFSGGNNLSINEDDSLFFKEADFNYQNGSGAPFTRLRVTSVTSEGSLTFNDEEVTVDQEILVSELGTESLKYVPVKNYNGEDLFSYSVGDESAYSEEPANMSLTIISVNDAPVFTISGDIIVSPNFTTTENVTVTATEVPEDEKDQTITYSLSPSSVDFASVAINPQTGLVSITSITDASGTQQFEIIADDGQDMNNQFTNQFILTVSDENFAPLIADQVFSIVEQREVGTTVGTVIATDPNGTTITYTINSGNESGVFDLNSETGILTVANSELLDFETTPTFNLVVAVSDGDLSSTATITVNLSNDSENTGPVIMAQSFSIEENSANDTTVGTVNASDPENDQLNFSIISGNDQGVFAIAQTTGVLTVADMGQLDFEVTPVFTLSVSVSDGDISADAEVIINITDVEEFPNNAPVITNQTFSVTENSAVGTLVGMVQASDQDNNDLVFSITDGNADNTFEISPSNGEIIVSNSNSLTLADNPVFNLTVSVSDGIDAVTAIITINLAEETVTSNEELPDNVLLLYPNPAFDYISIKNADVQKITAIKVIDLTGKTIKTINQQFDRVNVSDLKPGLYQLLVLKKDGTRSTLELIKQ